MCKREHQLSKWVKTALQSSVQTTFISVWDSQRATGVLHILANSFYFWGVDQGITADSSADDLSRMYSVLRKKDSAKALKIKWRPFESFLIKTIQVSIILLIWQKASPTLGNWGYTPGLFPRIYLWLPRGSSGSIRSPARSRSASVLSPCVFSVLGARNDVMHQNKPVCVSFTSCGLFPSSVGGCLPL